jgi:hypothetical protein
MAERRFYIGIENLGLNDSQKAILVDELQRLSVIFNVAVSTITHTVIRTVYGPVVTFTRTVDRLRMVVFGGVSATYDESHAACLTYLLDNQAAWEEGE